MKKPSYTPACLCLLLTLAPVAVFAAKEGGPKARLMAKYDTNKNGVIDGDEIAVVRAAYGTEPAGNLKKYDANHDGKLDDAEIATIKPPGTKDKVKSATTEKKADHKPDAPEGSGK